MENITTTNPNDGLPVADKDIANQGPSTSTAQCVDDEDFGGEAIHDEKIRKLLEVRELFILEGLRARAKELGEREVNFDDEEEEDRLLHEEKIVQQHILKVESKLCKLQALGGISDEKKNMLKGIFTLNVTISDTGNKMLDEKLTAKIAEKSGPGLPIVTPDEVKKICREVRARDLSFTKYSNIPSAEDEYLFPSFITHITAVVSKSIRDAFYETNMKISDFINNDVDTELNPPELENLTSKIQSCPLEKAEQMLRECTEVLSASDIGGEEESIHSESSNEEDGDEIEVDQDEVEKDQKKGDEEDGIVLVAEKSVAVDDDIEKQEGTIADNSDALERSHALSLLNVSLPSQNKEGASQSPTKRLLAGGAKQKELVDIVKNTSNNDSNPKRNSSTVESDKTLVLDDVKRAELAMEYGQSLGMTLANQTPSIQQRILEKLQKSLLTEIENNQRIIEKIESANMAKQQGVEVDADDDIEVVYENVKPVEFSIADPDKHRIVEEWLARNDFIQSVVTIHLENEKESRDDEPLTKRIKPNEQIQQTEKPEVVKEETTSVLPQNNKDEATCQVAENDVIYLE